MPEWLQESLSNGHDVRIDQVALRLAVALVLGGVVAGVYRLTRGPATSDTPSLAPTLVLLTVLICMVTLVIGNSVARAFSLVGALAIVRFRTVVEDTRDTAFVIFAVAVGMSVGAGFITIVLTGIPFASVAALLFRQRAKPLFSSTSGHVLTVRLGIGVSPDALLKETFGKHLISNNLIATVTTRQGASLDLSYAVRLRPGGAAAALVSELNGLEGVQGVELRQA